MFAVLPARCYLQQLPRRDKGSFKYYATHTHLVFAANSATCLSGQAYLILHGVSVQPGAATISIGGINSNQCRNIVGVGAVRTLYTLTL